MAGISTGISLLTVGGRLLDYLHDWWDFTSGSFVSAKGVTATTSGVTSVAGVVTEGVNIACSAGSAAYLQMHKTKSTGVISFVLWHKQGFNGNQLQLTVGGNGVHPPSSGFFIKINFGANTISDNNAHSYSTGTALTSGTAGVNGYIFKVIQITLGTYPAFVANIYDGAGTLLNSVSMSNLQYSISAGNEDVTIDEITGAASSGNISLDCFSTFGRGLTTAEIVFLYNGGAGSDYARLLTL